MIRLQINVPIISFKITTSAISSIFAFPLLVFDSNTIKTSKRSKIKLYYFILNKHYFTDATEAHIGCHGLFSTTLIIGGITFIWCFLPV